MNINEGKKSYSSYAETQKVATNMRRNNNENYHVYKVGQEWMVGGVHIKQKQPYKRVKTLQDIELLFSNVDNINDSDNKDIIEYYDSIYREYQANKFSEINGDDMDWIVKEVKLMTGRELNMNNDNTYLVVFILNGSKILRLKMGGAFSKSIPLVKKQAESLINNSVIWHTWNSKYSPEKWNSDSWFYMLEKAI